jgi:hypothetical protein
LIQAQRDLVELRLREGGQVGSSEEVLPQQQIRVLVRRTLPGTLWIAEVDLHIRGQGVKILERNQRPVRKYTAETTNKKSQP